MTDTHRHRPKNNRTAADYVAGAGSAVLVLTAGALVAASIGETALHHPALTAIKSVLAAHGIRMIPAIRRPMPPSAAPVDSSNQ